MASPRQRVAPEGGLGATGSDSALAGFRQAVQPSSTEGRGIVFTLFCVSVEGVKEGLFGGTTHRALLNYLRLEPWASLSTVACDSLVSES